VDEKAGENFFDFSVIDLVRRRNRFMPGAAGAGKQPARRMASCPTRLQ
jgi:hypothetical protein